MSLEWNESAVGKIEKAITAGLTECARQVQSQAKALIREKDIIDQSRLVNSIEYQVKGNEAYIGTNVEYAMYIEYGTGIYATGKGGSRAKKIPWVYYNEKLEKFITTKGQRPRSFLREGLDLVKPDLQGIFDYAWNKVIGRD